MSGIWIRTTHSEYEVRVDAIRDECLCAIHNPCIALLHSRCLDTRHVATCIGLGNRNCTDVLACHHLGQPTSLLVIIRQ